MKIKPVSRHSDGQLLGYAHWCEGCKEAHVFYTTAISAGHKWTFDGNMESPTFTPSMRFYSPAVKDAAGNVVKPEVTLCHYVITKGEINYLADSTDHEVRGKRAMVDIPDDWQV